MSGGEFKMSEDERSVVTILDWIFLREGNYFKSQLPNVNDSDDTLRPCLGLNLRSHKGGASNYHCDTLFGHRLTNANELVLLWTVDLTPCP